MENIDEIIQMWNSLDSRLDNIENETKQLASRVAKIRQRTARQRLETRYLKFIVIAAAMIPLSVTFVCINPMIATHYRLPLAVCWGLFFLAKLLVDFYLLRRLRSINIYTDTVSTTAAKALSVWRIHKIAVACGLPAALLIAGFLAVALGADRYMLYAMCAGAIVGFFIGMRELLKFRESFHDLRQGTC